MKRSWLVYCHTERATGRGYVGITSGSMESRWRQHLSRSRRFAGRSPFQRELGRLGPGAFDHELIASLGCDSVLNMPVRFGGQTLGTLNLLHRAGWYSEADIPTTRLFAHLALPAMLLISRR